MSTTRKPVVSGMRKRMNHLAWMGGAVLLLSGCGVTGHWTSRSIDPQISRDKFRLFGEAEGGGRKFTQATIDLHDDRTFIAEVHYGERREQVRGKWEKDGDRLTLVDSQGRSQTYIYKLNGDQSRLSLKRQIDGTDIVLELERKS